MNDSLCEFCGMHQLECLCEGDEPVKPFKRKRAGYREAVRWVAGNDSAGDSDALELEAVSGLVTIGLVADLFGKTVEQVGAAVIRERKERIKLEGPVGQL